MKRPKVNIYVRHLASCNKQGGKYAACACPKWMRWTVGGKQHRRNANTGAWVTAVAEAEKIQKTLDANTAVPVPIPKGSTDLQAKIKTFLLGKESENISAPNIAKHEHRLRKFESFLAMRGKFDAADITVADVVEFRKEWKTWKGRINGTWSVTTVQKAQTNLKQFLTFCGRADLLGVLKPVRQTREDNARLSPKPFSETELKRMEDLIPTVFPDPAHQQKMTAIMHLMVSSGLAIRDAAQLERANIDKDGYLQVYRQKTNKQVSQKLDPGLVKELTAVLNGNPRYFFTSGTRTGWRITRPFELGFNKLMKEAGCYIPGNLCHRFRDTAVDFWLGNGASFEEIAALIGDTPATVSKYYADLASKRMADRLAKLPVRKW